MRRLLISVLLLLLAGQAFAVDNISGEQIWSGEVRLTDNVVVPPGASLILKPGTRVLGAPGISLSVAGRFEARGTADRPILFSAAEANHPWQGLAFQNTRDVTMQHVRIAGAEQPVSAQVSLVRLEDVEIDGGVKGIALADSKVSLERVWLHRMREIAIEANVKSLLRVVNCRIEEVEKVGILATKQAQVEIRDNRISKAKVGILINGDFLALEGNRIDDCETGIGLTQTSPGSVVRGNRISGAKIGIGCRQFCAPRIEGNIVSDCERGIDCFQGSSPEIRNNRIVANQQGVVCVQMCNPLITQNEIADNQTGIYLHLSSYARIHANNFANNPRHLVLDNMSYDWEQRATHKPKRNRQAQNQRLVEQGRDVPKEIEVKVESEGFVDATGNYWGEETAREMQQKGPQANIAGIDDGFDVPILTYEGWKGEYRKDRVRYAEWKSARIVEAGLPSVQ